MKQPKSSQSGCALIVGAHQGTIRTIRKCLRTAKFVVMTALTPSQAQLTLETEEIRVVIADLSSMSGLGLLFIDEVRRLNVRLIAISQNPRLCMLAHCMDVTAVLTSPLRLDLIKAALETQPRLRSRHPRTKQL